MNKNDFFLFGKLTKCNRKTGQLTLVTDVDDASYYENIDIIFLDIDGGLVPFILSEFNQRSHDAFLMTLEDYDNPEKAQPLVGTKAYLPVNLLKKLGKKQFYFHEIVGYAVIDSQKGDIGKIVQVLEAPEQDILQISHLGKELLIPVIDEFIEKLDRRRKILFISAPEGLIDLYLNE
jgi:16S rRNA processing protein RimM